MALRFTYFVFGLCSCDFRHVIGPAKLDEYKRKYNKNKDGKVREIIAKFMYTVLLNERAGLAINKMGESRQYEELK